MALGGAMRGKRVPDLNESEADMDLDLTLSLSVGGASRKRVAELEPVPESGTHIAKLRNPEAVHNIMPSTGTRDAVLGTGAPAFNPFFHAKLKEEVLTGAGSSSAILSDKESGSLQAGSGTLSDTRSNSSSTALTASLVQYRLNPHLLRRPTPSRTNSKELAVTQAQTPNPDHLVSTNTNNANIITQTLTTRPSHLVLPNANNTSSMIHMPCVTVRGSGPHTQTVKGFIYQVSMAADVSIVCTCHWHRFSPAGFVEHAGLTNVENPLRQIVVLPP